MVQREFNVKDVVLIEVNETPHLYEVVEYDRPMCYASSYLGSADVVLPLDFAQSNAMTIITTNKTAGFRYAIAGIGGCFFSEQEAVDFLTTNMRYTIKTLIR
jgi:hypothetical protein